MLTLPKQIAIAIDAGGTIVVPSRQRAAALRLATAAAAIGRGLAVWPTPDVLPWTSWLAREAAHERHALRGERRWLRAAERWMLWRALAAELADRHRLLGGRGLAEALPRALARMADWGLGWRGEPTPEAALLREAGALWERRCAALGVADPGDWRRLAAAPAAGRAPAILAGFGTIGPARRAFLEARGVRQLPDSAPGPTAPRVHAAAECGAEFEAAADWARARLGRDPSARLLVIVPDLDRQRARLRRIFSAALGTATAGGVANYAFEGGQPLADYALVRTALGLLALPQRPLPFPALAELLRSPYVRGGGSPEALRIEAWLRERPLEALDARALRGLLPAIERELGAGAAARLQWFLEAGEAGPALDAPDGWARRLAARLGAAGWPGERPLDSGELQVRRRFDELLGDFATSGTGLTRIDAAAALDLLEAMAAEEAFEPATDDVPVTLSSRLEDPIVGYDGIWVSGCDAARWPAPPAPDAFIPLAVQRAAGLPEASADGQLARARAALAAWRAATSDLVLSHPCYEDDAELSPSGLLQGLEPWSAPPVLRARTAGAPRERLADATGPRLTAAPRGGVRLLELQAACPFRAYAELRLDAQPLAEPRGGLDPRVRGRVLHRSLERLWRGLGGSVGLAALDSVAQAERVRQAVRAALAAELAAAALEPPPLLRRVEERRAAALLDALLDAERERGAFEVVEAEARRVLTLDGAELPLRIDRIDRLADDRLAILDYKAGQPETFDPHAARPPRPQLPAYAVAAGAGVAAVATVHLRREGISWRGTADSGTRLPGIKAAGDTAAWPALLERWRAQLAGLLEEFRAGAAGVTPLPRACERCALSSLCRIDAARVAAHSAEDADGS